MEKKTGYIHKLYTQIWMTAVGINNIQLHSDQSQGCIQCLHMKKSMASVNMENFPTHLLLAIYQPVKCHQ